MGGGKATGARESARISTNLMQQYSGIGLPAVKAVTDYASQASDMGLPSYVERGYQAAGTAALEQSLSEAQGARRALPDNVGSRVGMFSSALTGSAGSLAREKAGLALSKAGATISQHNQFVKLLTGQGAEAVNLAGAFGNLTNRGLAFGLDKGDPTYEAITGGGAVASTLLARLLQNRGVGNADYSSPLAASYSVSQIPVFG